MVLRNPTHYIQTTGLMIVEIYHEIMKTSGSSQIGFKLLTYSK